MQETHDLPDGYQYDSIVYHKAEGRFFAPTFSFPRISNAECEDLFKKYYRFPEDSIDVCQTTEGVPCGGKFDEFEDWPGDLADVSVMRNILREELGDPGITPQDMGSVESNWYIMINYECEPVIGLGSFLAWQISERKRLDIPTETILI